MSFKKCEKCGAETSAEDIGEIMESELRDVELKFIALAQGTGDTLAEQGAKQLNGLRRVLSGLRRDYHSQVKLNDALPAIPFVTGIES